MPSFPSSSPVHDRRTPVFAIRSLVLVLLLALAALVAAPTVPAHAATTGELDLTPGQQASVPVSGSMLDAEAIATFTVPAERSVWLGLQLRGDETNGYRTRIRVLADGAVTVGFSRVVNGSETILSTTTPDLKVGTGDRVYVQGQISGTDPVELGVRAWQPGQARSDWQATYTDSSSARVTDAGRTRVWGYLSGSAAGPSDVAFDDASSTPLTTSAPAPEPSETPTPAPSPTPTATPSPTATPTSGTHPTAATTGVPAGTKLTRHDGDITVTTDGTVLDRMDIHGFVTVRAKNVRITNSIVRGGQAKGYDVGLITDYGYPGLVVEDTTVTPEYPSVYFDGIKGWDFTARRVHVVGDVDSVKIHGDDATVEDSLLEKTTYYASDPSQGGGPTHNDNVQILRGSNLHITGNTLQGSTNFAVLAGAEQGGVDVEVRDNYLDGGYCTVKLQLKNGWSERATVTGNVFGPNRTVRSCAFTAYPDVNLTAGDNVFESDGSAVPIVRVVS